MICYRGLGPALVRAFPLHAIIFVTYEAVMSKLKE
ncbi:hypothetical protein EON65_36560 [archaeon]|nr:MAG: hypothetical protein EON65_36560 [archaeon]